MKNYSIMQIFWILTALAFHSSLLFADCESCNTSCEPCINPIWGYVKFNSKYAYDMLDHTEDLRKTEILLNARRCGEIENCSLYLGFSILPIADYQTANKDSKFGYLMRHPTPTNQVGKIVSEVVLHSAQFNMTANVTDWLTGYGEFLYDPEQSFGAGTITTLTRNQIQLRKGYVLIGDLTCWPFYLALGKMDAPFGQMSTVSPFTSSTMWHAFGGLAYGLIIGYEGYGVNTSFMALQGGSQFRALHTPVKGTNVPSRINNFVYDINYTYYPSCCSQVKVGASYENGSAYCQDFPVVHFEPCEDSNPAWTVYGKLCYHNLLFKAGFAKTVDVWPGTHNPNPPLDIFKAHKVSSLDAGVKWTFCETFCTEYAASLEYSDFLSGPKGSPWRRQTQIVFGLSGKYRESSKFFAEVIRVRGYVPLNFISGGNFDDLGVTHSEAGATNTVAIIGAQICM